MEKDSDTIFRELKDDLSTYVELKLELLKLSAYERIGKISSVLSYGLVVIVLAFFFVLFIFTTLGFFLGEELQSTSAGFAIVSGIYLLVLVFILLNKKRIRRKAMNIIIAVLMNNDDKNDDEHQSSNTTPDTDF